MKEAKEKVQIIAEAGVNHNGDIVLAKELIHAAAEAKADLVKFQTFKAGELVMKDAEMAEYQKANMGSDSGSQYEMLRKLELSHEIHYELIEECKKKGIRFASTPFDIPSAEFLTNLGLDFFKIPSGEITNYSLLKCLGSKGKKIVMSTGMCSMEDIRNAVELLNNSGTSKEDLTILHCNTEYPTPFRDVNLHAMQTIREEFGVKVGYSDHTLGIEVPIAAVALGACVIEKHFTLDRRLEGPDHKASLEPGELSQMVRSIRNIEAAMGSGLKEPSPSEIQNMNIARKSVVFNQSLEAGTVIQEEHLTAMRPGDGVSPMEIPRITSQKLTRSVSRGEQFVWDDISS